MLHNSQAELDQALFKVCYADSSANDINLEQLEAILSAGANPNTLYQWDDYTLRYTGETKSRFPILHIIACKKNAVAAATILLKYNAHITQLEPHTGNTALLTAIAFKNEEYANFLIKAIKENPSDTVKKLLDQKDHKAPNWLNSPLTLAFKKGMQSVIESLVLAGANINNQDRHGYSSLHWAAIWRYDNIIRLLIEKGADKTLLTQNQRTAYEFYTYELGALDCIRRMKHDVALNTGMVLCSTNFHGFSDIMFHSMHRKHGVCSNNNIAQLLTTQQTAKNSLDEEYIEKFIEQDAIARSAKFITGYEYPDVILPTLQKEAVRLYGNKSKHLPPYAPTNSAVMFKQTKMSDGQNIKTVKDNINFILHHTDAECSDKYEKKNHYSNDVQTKHYQNTGFTTFAVAHPLIGEIKTKEVEQHTVNFPNLPWDIECKSPVSIILKIDNLTISFTDITQDFGSYAWRLLIKNNAHELGMIYTVAQSKERIMQILKNCQINELVCELNKGTTAKEIRSILIDGLKAYQVNHCSQLSL